MLPRLVHEVRNPLLVILYLLVTQECEQTDDEVRNFESSPTILEQWLMDKETLDICFTDNSFETINGFTRSHIASRTGVEDNLKGDFNAKDWIIEIDELRRSMS